MGARGKLGDWLFGYRVINIDTSASAEVASLLLRMGINARLYPDGRLLLGLSDYARFCAHAREGWILSVGEPRGVGGFFYSARGSIGVIIGCIVGLLLNLLLSNLIWDVRVDGNSALSRDDIISSLEECGFSVGDPFWQKDIGAIEAALLESNERLSWVSINRRGCVAYVKVMERQGEHPDSDSEKTGYCDIVAVGDGVITELSLKSGTALVKVGDTVKAGDILIGGYVVRDGISYPTYAEGRITAQSTGEIIVDVSKEEEHTATVRGDFLGFRIKIFCIFINLLKNSGKMENDCDIIEDEEVYVLFGKYPLPISITRVYRQREEKTTVTNSTQQLPLIARERMSTALGEYLGEGELLRMKSSGELTDKGYRLTTYFVFLHEIGTEQTRNIQDDYTQKGEQ